MSDLAIPDYLKDMLADGSAVDTTSDMQIATGGVPRLSTKGKTFRFKEGEDEVKAGQSIDVIIVGMSPEKGLAHTYYASGYTPDSNDPPDCSSADGVQPDSWVSNPVHSNCAQCPNQVWGSAQSMSGGKAKACKDSKHLYVARAEDFKANPKDCTLYILSVTVNSLKAFSNYGKELSANGIPGPQFCLTRISMDDEASVPKLEFQILGLLGEDHGKASNKRAAEKSWESNKALSAPKAESKSALPDPKAKSEEQSDESVDDLITGW